MNTPTFSLKHFAKKQDEQLTSRNKGVAKQANIELDFLKRMSICKRQMESARVKQKVQIINDSAYK